MPSTLAVRRRISVVTGCRTRRCAAAAAVITWPSGDIFAVVLLVGVASQCIDVADSQCSQIVVSNAFYQMSVDGIYKVYKMCNQQWSWVQLTDNANQSTNYVFFANYSYWYIGSQLGCVQIPNNQNILAKAFVGTKIYPYNVPPGDWQELSNERAYVSTPLSVACRLELSSVQMAFVVCGSTIVAVAAILSIAFCVIKVRERRRMMTSEHALQSHHGTVPPNDEEPSTGVDYDIAIGDSDGISCSDLVVPNYSLVGGALPIEPPLYSTVVTDDCYFLPPPSYDQAIN